MKKDIFERGIILFARQFPEKSIDSMVMWMFLKDLTDEQFMGAINKIIQDTEDVNRATNLVALIRKKALTIDLPTSGEAWAEVSKEIRKVGAWGFGCWSTETVAKAVDAIGWKNLCMSENISIERAQFMRIYDQMLEREKEKIGVVPLTEDRMKELTGDSHGKPLQIGEDKK